MDFAFKFVLNFRDVLFVFICVDDNVQTPELFRGLSSRGYVDGLDDMLIVLAKIEVTTGPTSQ